LEYPAEIIGAEAREEVVDLGSLFNRPRNKGLSRSHQRQEVVNLITMTYF
jgi:hypothetical protein